jgi:Rieske Fe-S protein
MSDFEVRSRRQIMGVAAIGAGALALGACSSDDDGGSSGTANPSAGSGSSGASGALASTSDIPVGGGTVFKDQKVVVTQPASGEFKAFTAVCTHRGCLVGKVANGTIDCPCHGSQFSATDGSVKKGPATTGLDAVNITVSGSDITLA